MARNGDLWSREIYSRPMNATNRHHRARLEQIARWAMVERDLLPDFSPSALQELTTIRPAPVDDSRRDLRDLLWASIDNDDSRDHDPITAADHLALPGVFRDVALARSQGQGPVRRSGCPCCPSSGRG